MYKHRTLIAFIVLAALQVFVPAQMILHQETLLSEGKEYKFRTAPIDPNDPFRGKYITLDFRENSVHVANALQWSGAEYLFAFLSVDKDGFAKVDSLSETSPSNGNNYIKVSTSGSSGDRQYIEFPFERFYMEESKAKPAEKAYLEASRDTTHKTYAVVRIKDGEGAIEDVMIDEKSIREIVKEQNKKSD